MSRGFLPRGLSNTCPQVCATRSAVASHGQVSNSKRAGDTPRELEAYQRDAPGCQRCGSNSWIRPAGCVGSRVSTSLM